MICGDSGNYYSSSLDVEGLEEGVLETVPWQKVILSCVLETVGFYHATFQIKKICIACQRFVLKYSL